MVEEDVLGNLSGAKSLQLRWTNWPTGGPYADYSDVNGREALWFLMKRDGTVEAMIHFVSWQPTTVSAFAICRLVSSNPRITNRPEIDSRRSQLG
jgi:hypothetical protein